VTTLQGVAIDSTSAFGAKMCGGLADLSVMPPQESARTVALISITIDSGGTQQFRIMT